MTQVKPQGIVDQLNSIQIKKLEGNKLLSELKQELEGTELYLRIVNGEKILSDLNVEENELRQQAKQILLDSGVKKFEALDGTIIQLNKKPGKLIIEDESTIDDIYFKVKETRTLDKKALKEDMQQGCVFDGVHMEEDYNLVIKNK